MRTASTPTPLTHSTNHLMKTILITAISAAFLAPAVSQANDPVQPAAATVLEQHTAHTLTLIVTRKAGNQDKTFEVNAIAIDENGLLATSIGAIKGDNPVGNMMAAMMGGGAGDNAGELTRVAWIRDDATEVECQLVLNDELLDLAFIRITAGDGVEMPTPPAPAKAAPALLDGVITISRMSPEFQRTPRAGLGHVSALITTPRELYQISDDTVTGTPVYTMDGGWLGILAEIEDESVVVPAAAILRRAESAPAAESP